MQAGAMGEAGAAGALMFTCNGRGRGLFGVADHDADAVEEALAAPVGGFFCAGEIGPVGGRNFLHGFTATLAVFAAVGACRAPPRSIERMTAEAELERLVARGAGRGSRRRRRHRRGDGARRRPRPRPDRAEAARRRLRLRRRARGLPPDRRRRARPADGRGPVARRRAGRGRLHQRPGPGAARGRAHGAQPARPPLRRRDADRAYVEARPRRPARVAILDTRKTTPGLRALEKAAVRAGGGPQPPDRPLRRDPDQGEPRRARRRPGRGRRRRPRGAAGSAGRGRVPRRRPRSRRRSRAGADRLLLDNMDAGSWRGAVAARDAARLAGEARGLRRRQPRDGRRRSPPPASTSSRSAP